MIPTYSEVVGGSFYWTEELEVSEQRGMVCQRSGEAPVGIASPPAIVLPSGREVTGSLAGNAAAVDVEEWRV